jgi:phosphoribosylformylglycinamidine cyclo-ligase
MGSGYAVYCESGAGAEVVALARSLGLEALVAGSVEQGPRQVIVEPVGVRYAGQELEFSATEHPPS